MPTQDSLDQAILAMHTYNVGANARMADLEIGIGHFTLLNSISFSSTGFAASAYQDNNGHIFISYRGTDFNEGWADKLNGWGLGVGYGAYDTPQLVQAVQYYQHIADLYAANDLYGADITLTGHSLGGGLAGYVASVYGKHAVIFDTMVFEDGVEHDYSAATTAPTSTEGAFDLDLLYPNGLTAHPLDGSHVSQYATFGEALTLDRVNYLHDGDTQYLDPSWFGLTLPVTLHSMALQVDLQWAALHMSSAAWSIDASVVWDAYFNENVALAVPGAAAAAQGTDGSAVGSLEQAIAYSAIASGVKPFGDTAIYAMFDDMEDLGYAAAPVIPLGAFYYVNDDLAKTAVEYAGKLAFNTVLAADNLLARNGALIFAGNGSTISVDLSDAHWTFGNAFEAPSLKTALIDDALVHSVGTADFARAMNDYVNYTGATVTDPLQLITSVSYQLTHTQGASVDIPSGIAGMNVLFLQPNSGADASGSGQDRVIVGTAFAETIYGGDQNDVILGGDGDDDLAGGDGQNFLYAGSGDDTIHSTGMFDIAHGDGDSDHITGDGVWATLSGDGGNDIIIANGDFDQALGGSGTDAILLASANGIAQGNGGDDLIVVTSLNASIFGDDDVNSGESGLADGNDAVFITGGGYSTVDLGGGDDILVFDGAPSGAATTSYITLGGGNDSVWIGRDADEHFLFPGAGSQYWFSDSNAGDHLYWNGYALLGGTFTVLLEQTNPEIYNGVTGWVDDHGVIYSLGGQQLDILLPDNSEIHISDFQTGDFGMSFDEFHDFWDLNGLPRASTANDG